MGNSGLTTEEEEGLTTTLVNLYNED